MANEFIVVTDAVAAQIASTRTSKFARRIARKISGASSDDLHIDACIVDAELREIRTILEALLDVVITEGAESYSQATCQRARTLMERMAIK